MGGIAAAACGRGWPTQDGRPQRRDAVGRNVRQVGNKTFYRKETAGSTRGQARGRGQGHRDPPVQRRVLQARPRQSAELNQYLTFEEPVTVESRRPGLSVRAGPEVTLSPLRPGRLGVQIGIGTPSALAVISWRVDRDDLRPDHLARPAGTLCGAGRRPSCCSAGSSVGDGGDGALAARVEGSPSTWNGSTPWR